MNLKFFVALLVCFFSFYAFAAGGPGGGDGGGSGGSGGGSSEPSSPGGGGSSVIACSDDTKCSQPRQYCESSTKVCTTCSSCVKDGLCSECCAKFKENDPDCCYPGQCFIGGKCYDNGMADFLNESQYCNFQNDSFGWSVRIVEKVAVKEEKTDASVFDESGLNCGQFASLNERIACRMRIQDTGVNARLAYLPEECRVLAGLERAECLQRFDAIQACRGLPSDGERDKCFSNKLKLKGVSELTSCRDKACVGLVSEDVYKLAKFRIYNLEEKAEEIAEEFPKLEKPCVQIIADLELLKQEFNAAVNFSDKKDLLNKAKRIWLEFRSKIKDEFVKAYAK